MLNRLEVVEITPPKKEQMKIQPKNWSFFCVKIDMTFF